MRRIISILLAALMLTGIIPSVLAEGEDAVIVTKVSVTDAEFTPTAGRAAGSMRLGSVTVNDGLSVATFGHSYWWDNTYEFAFYEDEFFEEGNEYSHVWTVKLDEGYKFADEPVIELNGSTENVDFFGIEDTDQMYFWSKPRKAEYDGKLHCVQIENADVIPVIGGKAGDLMAADITADGGYNYVVNEDGWNKLVNEGAEHMDFEDTFSANAAYFRSFVIEPDGNFVFDENTWVTINGEFVPCRVFADGTLHVQAKGTYENLKYRIMGGKVKITGYETMPVGELVIPETIEGYPVTHIGDSAFYDCTSITSVKMPSVLSIGVCAFAGNDDIGGNSMKLESVEMPSVQSIGMSAFFYCKRLKSVEMPNIISIGDRAFYDCKSITSVTIPSVHTIGRMAFCGCHSMTSIVISEDNENYFADGGMLYNKDKTVLICYPSAKGDKTIADSVLSIEEYAFYTCSSLTSVEMPNVLSIGNNAFYACISLTSVKMASVQSIGFDAFYYCISLASVDLQSVLSIGAGAFCQCKSLTSVEMHNVRSINLCAFFGCESLTSAFFYSDVLSEYGDGMFSSCANGFTIYFAKGTQGWTIPTWRGYHTKMFDPETGVIYNAVTFIDSLVNAVIVKVEVEPGADVTFPEAPEHEGYTFTGWDSDGKNITDDITITALYEKKTYTVTFIDGVDNSVISTVTVEHGADATFPEAPEHECYTFTGWDSDGKNITDDITITALYEKLPDPTPTPTQHPTPTPTQQPTPTSEPELLTGDLNGDDKVNTADAVVVLKYAAEMIQLDEKQIQAGDTNHDGKVNTADAVLILKYAAGMISAF